jgi:hypothetical protein
MMTANNTSYEEWQSYQKGGSNWAGNENYGKDPQARYEHSKGKVVTGDASGKIEAQESAGASRIECRGCPMTCILPDIPCKP